MANIGKNTGNIVLNNNGFVKDSDDNLIINNDGKIVVKNNTIIRKNNTSIIDGGNDEASIITTKKDLFFNARNLAENFSDKRKFNESLIEVPTNHSFLTGKYYYLLNYFTENTDGHSIITDVVSSMASSSLSGSALTENITNIEMYFLSNRKLNNAHLKINENNGYRINTLSSVNVGNVSKISIEGLKRENTNFEKSIALAATLNYNRSWCFSVLMKDKIYLCGGSPYLSVEKINTNNDSISLVPDITVLGSVKVSCAAEKFNNYMYIIGGTGSTQNIEEFNTTNDTSNGFLSGTLLTAVTYHSSVIDESYIYVIGGFTINQIQKYNLNNQVCVEVGSSIFGSEKCDSSSSNLVGGHIYIIGSTYYYGSGYSGRRLNIATETLTTFGTLREEYYHTGTLMKNYLYIIGGITGVFFKMDTITETYKTDTPNNISRMRHAATLVGSQVYLSGGQYTPTSIEKVNIDVVDLKQSNVALVKFN